MATEPSIDASSRGQRRGASRPTIVLGLACIGGFVGLVAGGFIGFHALGMELPDHADLLPFCMLVGAGVGWLTGAGLGSIPAKNARPPGTTGRWLLLGGVVVVVIGALAIAISPVPAGWPEGGVRFFWYWDSEAGAMAGVAILIDAALAVATFWVVSSDRDGDGSGRPGRFVGAIGIAGLILGWLSFALALVTVERNWAATLDHQQCRVVYRTTSSLAGAAGRRLDRTGSFPKDLDQVLAAGGTIKPGAVVEFAGVVDGSFCVRVGVDEGEDPPSDPHYSALVHRRPRGSHAWVGSEIGVGNSCRS